MLSEARNSCGWYDSPDDPSLCGRRPTPQPTCPSERGKLTTNNGVGNAQSRQRPGGCGILVAMSRNTSVGPTGCAGIPLPSDVPGSGIIPTPARTRPRGYGEAWGIVHHALCGESYASPSPYAGSHDSTATNGSPPEPLTYEGVQYALVHHLNGSGATDPLMGNDEAVGSRGIRRRKPHVALPRLKSRGLRTQDEPPVMWSPGFEASPNSPAGEMQGFWRLTGRGSDRDESEARARQRPIGRAGRFVLRLLGFRGRRKLERPPNNL